MQVLFIITHR